jgi:hypothetical protein
VAETFKVLGQSNPGAATPADLYTVPAATKTVISTLVVANRSATPDKFRISIAVAGEVTDNKQYLYYDVDIPGNDTFAATLGVTIATTDVVRVYSTNGTCSFNLFGAEVT